LLQEVKSLESRIDGLTFEGEETLILEDLRCIPTVEIMLHEMPLRPWMRGFTSDQIKRMQNLVIEQAEKRESGDAADD